MVSVCAYARQISEDEAAAIATEFLNSTTVRQTPTKTAVHRAKVPNATEAGTAPFYVFNADNSQGFVIVSGDDRAQRILGYSDKGTFDFTNLPPQLNAMLENYGEQIKNIPANTPTHASWKAPMRASEEGGVLLETAEWGQGAPFNTQCPVINGVQAPTGCVATAMAIVMKYHNWPDSGRYIWEFPYENISVDFSKSHYNFDSFKDKYDKNDELTPEVLNMAHLLYDAGLAANMYYTETASAASVGSLGHILMRFFRYSPECHYLLRKDYKNSEWESLIKGNLDNGLPIIYSGQNGEEAHAFVVDGYQQNMYHINWGWDGCLNGYFAVDALNPSGTEGGSYSARQGMIINIKPDYDSQEYSELWLDTGTDRGESFMPEWLQDSYRGMGMGIDCNNIISGIPFSLLVEKISAPITYDGEVGIALMDDNNIIEILKSVRIDDKSMSPTVGSVPYIYLLEASKWKDLVYDGPIDDSMRLQLVSRRTDSQVWEIVNGTEQTPSSLPVSGNTPIVLKQIVTYHGLDPESSDLIKYDSDISRIGQPLNISLECSFGTAKMYLDDVYSLTVDDFHSKTIEKEEESFGHRIDKTTMKVDIYYTSQNELPFKTINVVTPGTLYSYLDESDIMNIYGLRITGSLNNEDIEYLYNLQSLGEVDLSGATMENNELSINLEYPKTMELRVLNLPKTLQKITNFTCHASIINVPESLTDCGMLTARDYIVFNSSTPPSANYESIKKELEWYMRDVPVILIVPKGSKTAYQQHSHWKNFVDVVEMEDDDFFDASFKVEKDMMYCTITHNLTSITNNHRATNVGRMSLPNDPYEFPYRYTELPLSLNGRNIHFLKRICPNTALEYFNGRTFNYIPSGGFLSVYCFHSTVGDGWYSNLDYIISPLLQPNFSGIWGNAIVPAHSEIGKDHDTKDSYGNWFWNRYEMFSLQCGKKAGIVEIAPALEGVTIENVLINNQEVQPSKNQYQADFSNDVEIAVTYSFKGNPLMTTVYPADFVAKLPDDLVPTGIEDLLNTVNTENSAIVVCNISGQLVYQGHKDNLPELHKGIYIIKCGTEIHKIAVY